MGREESVSGALRERGGEYFYIVISITEYARRRIKKIRERL